MGGGKCLRLFSTALLSLSYVHLCQHLSGLVSLDTVDSRAALCKKFKSLLVTTNSPGDTRRGKRIYTDACFLATDAGFIQPSMQ